MKTKVILFIQIIFSTINVANCNCFEEKILIIGGQISYPQVAIENEIEGRLWFQIRDSQIVLDTLRELGTFNLITSSVENINWKILLEECEVNDLPKSFCIEFKLSKVDSIYLNDQKITIQKKSTRYILNPAIEECHFYTNSKLRINKNWSWSTSFGYKKGKKTVFKYLYFHEESPYWDDDEKIEAVYFQIPNGVEEFSLVNIELLEIDLFYESICEGRCYKKNVIKGSISGKKENREWLIKLSIDELEFEKKFKTVENNG